MKLRLLKSLALILLVPGGALSQQVDNRLDIPFVVTPMHVVREMLDMVDIHQNDFLFDLGCGDGRVVVMAAKEFGARGLGVDIDPERIVESRKKALKAGVTNQVKFVEGDLFELDLRPATVISIYLMTRFNLKLRPKLFQELSPGTRIVSHNYGMKDWAPDDYCEIPGETYTHKLFCWTMPANASGNWEWSVPAGMLKKSYRMIIRQNFQNITGSLLTEESEYPIVEGTMNGTEISLTIGIHEDNAENSMAFNGIVEGNTIEGSMNVTEDGKELEYRWMPVRDPLTVTSVCH